jgi:nicotinamidase-related amidase
MTIQADTVLLALHYQNDVVHPEGRIRVGIAEHSPERAQVVTAARTLLDGARRHKIPVVSVRIAFRPDHRGIAANSAMWRRVAADKVMAEGSWGAEFHEGLGPLPDEFVVHHMRNNAFYNSPLQDVLNYWQPRRLVVAGISTTYVVESTVRHASDVGYEIMVAADACSSADRDMHEASLKAMSLLATIGSVAEAVASFGG